MFGSKIVLIQRDGGSCADRLRHASRNAPMKNAATRRDGWNRIEAGRIDRVLSTTAITVFRQTLGEHAGEAFRGGHAAREMYVRQDR